MMTGNRRKHTSSMLLGVRFSSSRVTRGENIPLACTILHMRNDLQCIETLNVLMGIPSRSSCLIGETHSDMN
jgi:hypothetical protein